MTNVWGTLSYQAWLGVRLSLHHLLAGVARRFVRRTPASDIKWSQPGSANSVRKIVAYHLIWVSWFLLIRVGSDMGAKKDPSFFGLGSESKSDANEDVSQQLRDVTLNRRETVLAVLVPAQFCVIVGGRQNRYIGR